MPRRLRLALALAVFTVSCAARMPYNPFKIPREEIYGKVKTIALAPVGAPSDLENAEAAKATFESLIDAGLRGAGFSTVPSKEYAGIWKRVTDQLGGLFDPVTGKRDEAKYKTALEHTRRELSAKFNADAVLGAVIAPVTASFGSGVATWHGVRESMASGGFWASLMTGDYQGTVPALSLIAVVADSNGVDLYANAGGIQLLSKLSYGKFVAVPPNELLLDAQRNALAVDIALGPLTGQSTPTPEQGTFRPTPTPRFGAPR